MASKPGVCMNGPLLEGPCRRCNMIGPLDPSGFVCWEGCSSDSGELGVDRDGSHSERADRSSTARDLLASDVASGADRRPSALRFMTAIELIDFAPVEVPWVLDGYLARGAITLLAGKPKVGKSTFICALIEATVTGAPTFLGREVRGGPVVFVSEESCGTLAAKLPRHPSLHVLSRDAAFPKPSWAALVDAAVQHAREVDAVSLVIDTLAYWSAFGADREKDAGAVQEAMTPLIDATRTGLAVLLVHHQRKAGGDDGDAIRGSSALAGATDANVELERGDRTVSCQRQLLASSRWTTTPGVLVIERDNGGRWHPVAAGADKADAKARTLHARILRAAPADGDGISEPDLARALEVDARKVHGPLRELLRDGRIVQSGGKGVKGDPRLFRAAADVPPNASPSRGSIGQHDAPLLEEGEHHQANVSRPLRGASAPGDITSADRLATDHEVVR